MKKHQNHCRATLGYICSCLPSPDIDFMTPQLKSGTVKELEKKLTEMTKLLKGEPYLSMGAKAIIENYAGQLSSLIHSKQVEVVESCERIVRDVAHESEMKVGTTAFGNHYMVCSKLAELKKDLCQQKHQNP